MERHHNTVFYTAQGKPAPLINMFYKQACLLICGGPSACRMDWSLIKPEHNLVVAAVNNAAHLARPHLWFAQDPPYRFMPSIWEDARIMKFTRKGYERLPYNPDYPERLIGYLPNVWFHKVNSKLSDPHLWFSGSIIRWGAEDAIIPNKKRPNIFLCALGCLVRLGFRLILLAGADFHMDKERPYFFDETKSTSSVSSNNLLYKAIDHQCRKLKPLLDELGVSIYNCSPGTHMTAFPALSLSDALTFVPNLDLSASCKGKYKVIPNYNRRRKDLHFSEHSCAACKDSSQDSCAVLPNADSSSIMIGGIPSSVLKGLQDG